MVLGAALVFMPGICFLWARWIARKSITLSWQEGIIFSLCPWDSTKLDKIFPVCIKKFLCGLLCVESGC